MALTRTTIRELASAPDAIRQLAAKLPFDLGERDPDAEVLYSVGSVTLDQLVMTPNAGVLVAGDLVVTGVLDDRPFEADPCDMRYLVIGGDLRARGILLGSEAHVAGSVVVDDFLIAASDGHYTLHVGGDLVGRRLVALGHHVFVASTVKADVAIGYLGVASNVPKSQMAAAFRSELVNKWGGILVDEVAARALRGEPFLVHDSG